MADREFERADWLGNISRGLRIVAWAALVGGIGANALAFLIPIVGGTRGGLWISRYWSIAFEAVALIGLVATTHPPPVNDAKPVWTTTATVLRVLGGAAVISHLVVALLVDIGVDHDIRMVAGLSFRLLSLAAHVLLVWYVGGMLRRFGAVGTARALRWSAYALVALWVFDYPGQIVLALLSAPGQVFWLVHEVGGLVFGLPLLVWTCACLLRAAKLLPTEAHGRCINCGYVLFQTSRCSECGAGFETAPVVSPRAN